MTAPPGWYVEPFDPSRVRFWDGVSWTGHVASRPQLVPTPAVTAQAARAGWYPDPRSSSRQRYWDGIAWTGHVAPEITMTSQEWQRQFLGWIAAGALADDLWRMLAEARIPDGDAAILRSQHEMVGLTARQGADRVRLMLAANPSLRTTYPFADFLAITR